MSSNKQQANTDVYRNVKLSESEELRKGDKAIDEQASDMHNYTSHGRPLQQGGQANENFMNATEMGGTESPHVQGRGFASPPGQ